MARGSPASPLHYGPLETRPSSIRPFFSSPVAERATMKSAARMIPRLEAEVQALGRAFGEHSVGRGDVPER